MKVNTRALLSGLAIMLVLMIPSAAWAQHKHGVQKTATTSGMKMDMPMMMAMMMKSPDHRLMTAYMKSMSAFATSLRDQAMKPNTIDAEVARATVAELRHSLNAMEALHQKHMQSMSAEMQSKMKMMMEKMEKDGADMKNQVIALETNVQADKPDSAQISEHANALLKHLGMMSKMHGGSKAASKMPMKKKMEMKM
ncbi:MAG: hypothetical protein H0U60_01750 [Blastocatellia bacterium]|nr:hypothetical protein [Blastocatellia bacterium]